MGKYRKFWGTKVNGTQDTFIEAHANLDLLPNYENLIFIGIKDNNSNKNAWIGLDKPTAIKFHRELKKQISFIQEGDENGNR
jgi:hypothetical protein